MHTQALDPSSIAILSRKLNGKRSVTGLFQIRNGDACKVFHYKTKAPRLALEAQVLSLAQEATQEVQGIHPVRLVAYLRDEDILLTEHEDSERVFNWVFNPSSRFWRRARPIALGFAEFGRRLGAWLRAFHAAPVSSNCDWQEVVCQAIARTVRKCNALEQSRDPALHHLVSAAVRRQLEEWSATFRQWAPAPVGWVHGDLTLSNLGATPDGRVVIFDFADAHQGCQLEDLVSVLHELSAIGRTSARRSCLVQSCVHALLESYGAAEFARHREMVSVLVLWNSLRKLHGLVKHRRQLGWTRWLSYRRLFHEYERAIGAALADQFPYGISLA